MSAQADLVVVRVVSGRDLEAARTEVHLHIVVLDHRDLPVDLWDKDLLATQPVMTLIGGVHADGGIRHDGLGTRGGDHEILVGGVALPVGDVVFQVIEMALGVLVDHLVVADGRQGYRIPVDHTHAAVDPAFLVEVAERGNDGKPVACFVILSPKIRISK